VHNRREPQRHLLEKNGTRKFFENSSGISGEIFIRNSEEFLEKNSREILRNFLKLIHLFNSPKNP